MINWNHLQIQIDNQAKNQLDHYFDDLGKILENQNLSGKKNEVFHDLENYIIEYMANKELKNITFNDSLQIISELGPPDEYTDFSTMPSLIEEIQKQRDPKTNIIDTNLKSSTNYILCLNCNHKNEEKSSFCINCGNKLPEISNNKEQIKNPIKFVFNRNPEYFFSLLTFYLALLMIIPIILEIYLMNIILLNLIFINEVLIVFGIFLLRMRRIEFSRYELGIFLSTYLLKIIAIICILATATLLSPGINIVTYAITGTILAVFPILLTKLLFFSNIQVHPLSIFNKKVNIISKIGYGLSVMLSFLYILFALFKGVSFGFEGTMFFGSFFIYWLIFDWLIISNLAHESNSKDNFESFHHFKI